MITHAEYHASRPFPRFVPLSRIVAEHLRAMKNFLPPAEAEARPLSDAEIRRAAAQKQKALDTKKAIRDVLSDGKLHRAGEIAERIGSNRTKVAGLLAEMAKSGQAEKIGTDASTRWRKM